MREATGVWLLAGLLRDAPLSRSRFSALNLCNISVLSCHYGHYPPVSYFSHRHDDKHLSRPFTYILFLSSFPAWADLNHSPVALYLDHFITISPDVTKQALNMLLFASCVHSSSTILETSLQNPKHFSSNTCKVIFSLKLDFNRVTFLFSCWNVSSSLHLMA